MELEEELERILYIVRSNIEDDVDDEEKVLHLIRRILKK